MFLKTFSTIDWSTFLWHKRYFTISTTLRTDYSVHFPFTHILSHLSNASTKFVKCGRHLLQMGTCGLQKCCIYLAIIIECKDSFSITIITHLVFAFRVKVDRVCTFTFTACDRVTFTEMYFQTFSPQILVDCCMNRLTTRLDSTVNQR